MITKADKQRRNYFFIGSILIIIALITYGRFDMDNGYYWLIPCSFGFASGVFFYVSNSFKELTIE